jgi:hypothetical protein
MAPVMPHDGAMAHQRARPDGGIGRQRAAADRHRRRYGDVRLIDVARADIVEHSRDHARMHRLGFERFGCAGFYGVWEQVRHVSGRHDIAAAEEAEPQEGAIALVRRSSRQCRLERQPRLIGEIARRMESGREAIADALQRGDDLLRPRCTHDFDRIAIKSRARSRYGPRIVEQHERGGWIGQEDRHSPPHRDWRHPSLFEQATQYAPEQRFSEAVGDLPPHR